MKKEKARRKKTPPQPPSTRGDQSGAEMPLHVAERPDPAFAGPICIAEPIRVSRVGHTFGLAPPPYYSGVKEYVVQDFLLDQTQTSGTDGEMVPLKTFDLTQTTCYTFNVFARARRFFVKPPPSGEQVFMGFQVGRRFVNAESDVSDIYPAQSVFFGAAGAVPVFTYNNFFIGRNTNHWVKFWVDADVAVPFAFSSFRTTGTYLPRNFDPGPKQYRVHSSGLPFNLPGPDAVPYMLFSYRTTNSVDPGPFVSIR